MKVYGKTTNLNTGAIFNSVAEAALSVGGTPKALETCAARVHHRVNPLKVKYRGCSWEIEYFKKPKYDHFQHGLKEIFKATNDDLDFRILQTSQKLRLSPFVVALALRSYGIHRVPEATKERMFTLSRRLRDKGSVA